jgi:hypothetical protein
MALTDPEEGPPFESSTFIPSNFILPPWGGDDMPRDEDSDPFADRFALPLALEDLSTPIPPQDLTAVLAELTALVQAWRVTAADQRVPIGVRWICTRCADNVSEIIREHRQTDVSELAPESDR